MKQGVAVVLAVATLVVSANSSAQQCDPSGDQKISTADALIVLRAAVGQSSAVEKCQGPTTTTTTTTLPAEGYSDNGNGTISAASGLVWEKLSNDGSVHDRDNDFTWPDAPQKISALNTANFAGHHDWRLPTLAELQSLVDFSEEDPAIDPLFNTACPAGCSVTSCSCTVSDCYWSSEPSNTSGAKDVDFFDGTTETLSKFFPCYVRAVRGGM